MSVVIQVLFFKITKGRRIFKMTPLHHHFELMGWSETQIVQRFWLIGLVAGLIGVALSLV
jgi:phospho-N-acetylmuramoyl-pentapeptide-transferase